MKIIPLSLFLVASVPMAAAQTTTDTIADQSLQEVRVTARRPGVTNLSGALNGQNIARTELFKAACCNLGESFTTNPSVDVSYNDATTGARQIKLLGLSGTYVQMLTEQLPNFRGAASPYALGYVPGPWMKSIQVSKGSASVKNGYESITGQINVEYLKPEDDQGLEVNLYGDSKSRLEANAAGNMHFGNHTSGEILLHYENSINNHDENHDGFYDKPRVEQYNAQTRWLWKGDHYIFHGGISGLKEKRRGGQTDHGMQSSMPLFGIEVNTDRYEAYAKNAFILNAEHGTNIALMASGSLHQEDALYGLKSYSVNEKNAYASLMFETNFTEMHNLSVGLSLNHDYFGEHYRLTHSATAEATRSREKETTPGVYAQYTLTAGTKWTAMAGIRLDHSSLYGTFVTPRFHVKYAPSSAASFRLSAGKGYRTVHALAENNYLMASGRTLVIDRLNQEAAWNYGISGSFNIPLFGKNLKVNAEYYYTRFSEQTIVDYDSNPKEIRITNLNDGRSYSHTMQVDATYPFFQGFTLTAAYRLNDVRATYGGVLKEKPLTSRYKALVTASYKTAMDLWQFDATLQINGGGRMPEPYALADGTMSWDSRFGAYPQLSAQITRWFRHWSIYIGGENLTNFKQQTPIIGAANPWGSDFEPTMVWGPVHGWMLYAGVRINIGKL